MKLLPALVLVFGLLVTGNAQNTEKLFVLSGIVFDPQKAVVPEVEITFENQAGKIFKTFSTEEGTYKISIPRGKYTIEFRRPGFRSLKVINFQNGFLSAVKFDANLEVRFCDDCHGDILGVNNEDKRKPAVIDFSNLEVPDQKSDKCLNNNDPD